MPTLCLQPPLSLIGQRTQRLGIDLGPRRPLVQVGPWQTQRVLQREAVHPVVGNRRQEHGVLHGEQVPQHGAVCIERPGLGHGHVG